MPTNTSELNNQSGDEGQNWTDLLSNCDFEMVADEIRDMLQMASQGAASKGEQLCFQEDFLCILRTFLETPSTRTARPVLEAAPGFRVYFESCSPGGNFYGIRRFLNQRQSTQEEINAKPNLFCCSCGVRISPNAKFCPSCGCSQDASRPEKVTYEELERCLIERRELPLGVDSNEEDEEESKPGTKTKQISVLSNSPKPREKSYFFGKWYGYLQMAVGLLGGIMLLGSQDWFYAILCFLSAVIGYGLVEKRRWGLFALSAACVIGLAGQIASLGIAVQDTNRWRESSTSEIQQAVQQLQEEWNEVQNDPRWPGLPLQERKGITNDYFERHVKQNPIIAKALTANPALETNLRHVFSDQFVEANVSQAGYSSNELDQCELRQTSGGPDTCTSAFLTYHETKAGFTLAFAGVLLTYFWKRHMEFL
jgi:hypothetical protein